MLNKQSLIQALFLFSTICFADSHNTLTKSRANAPTQSLEAPSDLVAQLSDPAFEKRENALTAIEQLPLEKYIRAAQLAIESSDPEVKEKGAKLQSAIPSHFPEPWGDFFYRVKPRNEKGEGAWHLFLGESKDVRLEPLRKFSVHLLLQPDGSYIFVGQEWLEVKPGESNSVGDPMKIRGKWEWRNHRLVLQGLGSLTHTLKVQVMDSKGKDVDVDAVELKIIPSIEEKIHKGFDQKIVLNIHGSTSPE